MLGSIRLELRSKDTLLWSSGKLEAHRLSSHESSVATSLREKMDSQLVMLQEHKKHVAESLRRRAKAQAVKNRAAEPLDKKVEAQAVKKQETRMAEPEVVLKPSRGIIGRTVDLLTGRSSAKSGHSESESEPSNRLRRHSTGRNYRPAAEDERGRPLPVPNKGWHEMWSSAPLLRYEERVSVRAWMRGNDCYPDPMNTLGYFSADESKYSDAMGELQMRVSDCMHYQAKVVGDWNMGDVQHALGIVEDRRSLRAMIARAHAPGVINWVCCKGLTGKPAPISLGMNERRHFGKVIDELIIDQTECPGIGNGAILVDILLEVVNARRVARGLDPVEPAH